MADVPRRAFRKVLVANRGEIAVRVLRDSAFAALPSTLLSELE